MKALYSKIPPSVVFYAAILILNTFVALIKIIATKIFI